MKKKTLLLSSLTLFALTSFAQIHPASLWSLAYNYTAPTHTQETWTSQGYTIYNITMTRDANGYCNTLLAVSPPPMNQSVDSYQSNGSKTGNVYTSLTQKQTHGTTNWVNWRKDTWQSDGTKDTVIMWQDSIGGAWTNVSKHVLNYSSGNTISLVTDYTWTSGAWAPISKATMTYTGANHDKTTMYNWVTATSSWVQTGYYKYFYSTKLDSIQQWSTDVSGNNTLAQKTVITCDASGNVIAQQTKQWDSGTNSWKDATKITFTNGTTGIENISFESEYSVYPVPANEKITVKFSGNENSYNYHIADITGKEIMKSEINAQDNIIHTSQLLNGIYFLFIETEGRILSQRKIVIAH
jgi:hypothetical protein